MLKLQKLHLDLNKPTLLKDELKNLRLSTRNLVRKSKKPAKIINQTSLEWEQAITLPLLIHKQIFFEIYDQHTFGYNPQEIKNVFQGIIIIKNTQQTHNTWKVFSNKKQEIGTLSANIISKTPSNMIQTIQNSFSNNEKKILRIKSIVAHLPIMKNKKGYISIQIGNKKIDTKTIKSLSGQLVLYDYYQIQKQPQENQAKIIVYSLSIEKKVLGQGIFLLQGKIPPKKVLIMSSDIQVGQMFIDSKIIKSNNLKASRLSQYQRVSSSLVVDRQNSQQDQSKNYRKGSPKSNFYLSKLSNTQNKKRHSVINGNNDIKFARQKRFMIYQDKQNQNVTYIGNRSFEFRDSLTKKYYRGASLGRGEKTDFTKEFKSNPGVGDYKLPSIWDKY